MGLDKRRRAEIREKKDRDRRRERRRLKNWHNLQSRSYTDATLWDEQASADEAVEKYRNKVNRDCGMFYEEYDSESFYRRREASED